MREKKSDCSLRDILKRSLCVLSFTKWWGRGQLPIKAPFSFLIFSQLMDKQVCETLSKVHGDSGQLHVLCQDSCSRGQDGCPVAT